MGTKVVSHKVGDVSGYFISLMPWLTTIRSHEGDYTVFKSGRQPRVLG